MTYTNTPSILGQSATGSVCLHHADTNSQSIQGSREALACLPHSIITRSTEAVLSFNLGRWEFLSCVAVFTQSKQQSPKKIYTLTTEEEE